MKYAQVLLAAFSLVLVASGCVTMRTPDRRLMWIPIDRDNPPSSKQIANETAQCQVKSITDQQMAACMYLKGYTQDMFDMGTRQPVEGKPINWANQHKDGEVVPIEPTKNWKKPGQSAE
jgi:hypothetical protein